MTALIYEDAQLMACYLCCIVSMCLEIDGYMHSKGRVNVGLSFQPDNA